MIAETLCMGCMSELEGATVCAVCGWHDGQALDTPLQLPPRTVLTGQYLLGRALGHGGFGIVYLGWDMNLQLKVAIKEYLPGDYATRSPDGTSVTPYSGSAHEYFDYGLAKFLEEGRAIARFNDHPGIVPVLNFFKANGTGYLVMSYIPGRTLKEHLLSRGPQLPYRETFSIAMPVMDTLRAVHEVGLLHRDISPDNIYISNSKQVKLLDFGAARMALGDKSKSLSVILKSGYAPKEQYQTKGRQGPWTDVYALGATMYRSLTGQVPPESLDRNERDEMEPPRALGSDIPGAAEAVLLRALAVDPAARFQTVAEFQNALMAATPGQAVFGPAIDGGDLHAEQRRVPLPQPIAKPQAANDAVQKIAAAIEPFARSVVAFTGRLGLKPAPLDQAASSGAAAVAAGLVGVIGAWSSFSSIALSSALPGVLGPLAAITGLAAIAGNLALIVGAYLTSQNDPRGPVLGWAAASLVAAVAVASYVVFLLNYASVAGLEFAWHISTPQFNGLIMSLVLLAVVFVTFARRRA